MKIVIDKDIPYINQAFTHKSDIEALYMKGADISNEILTDADALIIRTRTICNEKLLKNTKIKAIATATIGYDHIDTEYCQLRNIKWSNAPGCNSESVNQYVAAAIAKLMLSNKISPKEITLGIIGVGHVGAKVKLTAEALGMNVILSDPPRAINENNPELDRLEDILKYADIITLHTPLTIDGSHRTFHLADNAFFDKLERNPFIINTCRGEVIDTHALKNALRSKRCRGAVIDCWENEPNIDLDLLKLCDIASPHIAGYSKDGKANGTTQALQFVSKTLYLGMDKWQCNPHEQPENPQIDTSIIKGETPEIKALRIILKTYDIEQDDKRLRDNTNTFEKQRGSYPTRREFSSYEIVNCQCDRLRYILKTLNFKIS